VPDHTPAHHARRVHWELRGLFGIAAVFALREAQPLLATVVIAAVLAFVLAPAVHALRRRGVPQAAGGHDDRAVLAARLRALDGGAPP